MNEPTQSSDRAQKKDGIRTAVPADAAELAELEERCFSTDRMSRRSFRRLIESPATARCRVAVRNGRLCGYALVLFREGTAAARLYSVAVAPEARGTGIGSELLRDVEHAAFEAGAVFLRLEVNAGNAAAIRLYEQLGYRLFGRHFDYYEDHADALRLEKRLRGVPPAGAVATPFWAQTTDFTCGPACMAMALARFARAHLDRRLELRLWREATTIYMTSGVGGCEPYGMAVALFRRGLRPRIHVSRTGHLFLDGVRGEEKREVMRLVQDDFQAEAAALGIPVCGALTPAQIVGALDGGAVVILLVSGYRMFRDRQPHWVLAHAHEGGHIYVHDPWIETDELESAVAAANLPIPVKELDRMARYGRERLRAAVLITATHHSKNQMETRP